MLPRDYRIPSSEMNTVLRKTRKLFDAWGSLALVRNSGACSRFAVIVPVKTDKRATRRNRIRRIVSESLRLIVPRLDTGWDCIFYIKKDISAFSANDVSVHLHELFTNAGLMGGHQEHS